jgi:hypothetical protein
MVACAIAFTICIILIGIVPGVTLTGTRGLYAGEAVHVANLAVAALAMVAFLHFAIRLPRHMAAISGVGWWDTRVKGCFVVGAATAVIWAIAVAPVRLRQYQQLHNPKGPHMLVVLPNLPVVVLAIGLAFMMVSVGLTLRQWRRLSPFCCLSAGIGVMQLPLALLAAPITLIVAAIWVPSAALVLARAARHQALPG